MFIFVSMFVYKHVSIFLYQRSYELIRTQLLHYQANSRIWTMLYQSWSQYHKHTYHDIHIYKQLIFSAFLRKVNYKHFPLKPTPQLIYNLMYINVNLAQEK